MFARHVALRRVTIVPVLCSRWLKTPDEEAHATGMMATFYRMSERFLDGMDERYRQAIHVALNHRPTVIAGAAALVVAAAVLYPMVDVELMPQTDEGEVNVNAELAVGTRVERPRSAAALQER
jgi:HAE1 family hydrophobic/amphiphilic exporter-1